LDAQNRPDVLVVLPFLPPQYFNYLCTKTPLIQLFNFRAIEVLRIKVTLKKARLPFLSTGRFDGVYAAAPQKDWSMR